MYWGLLLTCRIVKPCVDVIWHGYGWFLEQVNAVFGCSDVALHPNGSLWVTLALYQGSDCCGSGSILSWLFREFDVSIMP